MSSFVMIIFKSVDDIFAYDAIWYGTPLVGGQIRNGIEPYCNLPRLIQRQLREESDHELSQETCL